MALYFTEAFENQEDAGRRRVIFSYVNTANFQHKLQLRAAGEGEENGLWFDVEAEPIDAHKVRNLPPNHTPFIISNVQPSCVQARAAHKLAAGFVKQSRQPARLGKNGFFEACFRLYQIRYLQVSTHFAVFFEIYNICC